VSTPFEGAIFDVDGVLVDSPHEAEDEDLLAAADADIVVTSLDDVDVAAQAQGRLIRVRA
jgi:beta-phosphoglucomutase-like phosphatase (HAD superfamily)